MLALVPSSLRVAISRTIAAEYQEVGTRRKVLALFRRRNVTVSDYAAFVLRFIDLALLFDPTGEPPVCRDEKDRPYLHCALTAHADFLVTHDKDLLDLATIGRSQILQPRTLLQLLRQHGQQPTATG